MFHHWVSTGLSWLIAALSLLLGVVGTIFAFFASAFIISVTPLLVGIAFLVGFLIVFGGIRITARRMSLAKPGQTALGVGIGFVIILGLVSSQTILKPFPSTPAARQPPPVPSGVHYWNLPTGSHIAYLEIPAVGKAKAAPIILVGGGPGEEDVANSSQTKFFGQLSQLGYNVYIYDQIGSGLSARLDHPKQYTLARQVADLEAIRETIGAKQVILLGESWGGTLAANYMAKYPQYVAKAIFTSPAPIDYYEWPNAGGSVLSRLNKTAEQQANGMLNGNPKFIFWYLLGEVNPQAAINFVSNREADSLFNAFLQVVQPGVVCNAAHLPDQVQKGNGFYDNLFTSRSAQTIHPAVNPRSLLSTDHTPTLIMTGSCNYISWASTWQYKSTFPNSTLLYFQNAGHEIYLDKPDLYLASIRAFLLGEQLPVAPWTSAQPPKSFQGPIG